MTAGPALFLGIDGGGTGCRARLTDSTGATLGEGRAGPASLRLGAERSSAALLEAAAGALAKAGLTLGGAGPRIRACAGLAGLSRQGALAAIEAVPHPFAALRFVPDIEAACIGAHAGADGGIVVAGTGSCAFGVAGGRRLRFGGWGLPASDEGSGAAIGLAALKAGFRFLDGRARPSSFFDALFAALPGEPAALVAWADRADATALASLAPIVARTAGAGDPVAGGILDEAARAVDGLVRALRDAGVRRVALVGGLAEVLRGRMAEDLAEPAGDPLDGALILAGVPSR